MVVEEYCFCFLTILYAGKGDKEMKGKEEMTLNISERENYLMFLASVAVRPSKNKKENRKR